MSNHNSLDLLSAALSESGLTNSDGKSSHPTSLSLPSLPTSINSELPTSTISIKASTSQKSSVSTAKILPTKGVKIIKLPAIKSGSVIKIIKPSIVQANKGHQPSTNDNNTTNSNTSQNKVKSIVPKVGQVIAGGKAIFIPTSKPGLPKLNSVKILQPLTTKPEEPKVVVTAQKTNHAKAPTTSSGTCGLNLGSMFLENVEKSVDSDHSSPPESPFTIELTDQTIESSKPYNVTHLKNSSKNARTKTPELIHSQSVTIKKITSSNNVYHPLADKTTQNDGISIHRSKSLPASMNELPGEELVAEDEKEEEMHHAQTYAEYMPSKLEIGLPHPDSVVETSSLASISPPSVRYHLALPHQTIDQGWLSALQLESVVYACQKHGVILPNGERAGFLIGDGAGVGKGRSLAGIIHENFLVGRKRALWFSVSNDLRFDAERDLRDIGAKHIKVYPLNKFKYGKITAKHNGAVKKGIIFATYSSLIGESHSQAKYHTRLKQILHWCGEDFDGPIIFDECHKAKNLVPSGSGKSTKTGKTVLELQNQLPNARVVYASATGASEPRNMAYMSRLGLWGSGTQFKDFMEFIQAVERRGVGAMELVAMDMKLRGSYIARQLSFYGVSFKIEEVELDPAFVNVYNQSVKLWVAAREAFQIAASMMTAEYHMIKTMWAQFWSAHQRFFKYLCMSAKVNRTVSLVREAVKHGKCVVIGLQSTGEAGTVDQLEKNNGELDEFVSTARTVFENLINRHFPAPDRSRITALFGNDFYRKPEPTVENRKRKHEEDDQVTSPAPKRQRSSSSDSSDFYSDSSHVSDEEDIHKIFADASDSEDCESPVKQRGHKHNAEEHKEEERKEEESPGLLNSLDLVSGTLSSSLPGMNHVEKAQALKQELLNRIEQLGPSLPNNLLDQLIDALGGVENVAEMTGRKGRVISTDEGVVQYQRRSEDDVPVELINIKEKQRFMDGEKNIAILSEAASSGISLQSDKRARNQRKRVHVTVELPWSADRAVQQFGRTHRSNQANAPEYVFLITELAGEQRFASIVAKRLESLGALTHGDRRATESRDLSRFNYDTKYGRKALDCVMKAIAGLEAPLVPPPTSYQGNFFKDISESLLGVGLLARETGQINFQLDKDYLNIFKFMNRILGMEVEKQNAVFAFFTDTLNAIIAEAKKMGEYDRGIMDLGSSSGSVERVKCRDFPISSGGCVSLHTVKVERGTSWEEAVKLLQTSGDKSSFYITFQKRNRRHMVILATEYSSRRYRDHYVIYRPNTGKQSRRESGEEIRNKYRSATVEEAERWWREHYDAAMERCSHQYWQGSCSRGPSCTVGKRRRMFHVLSGSVLLVWRTVEKVLSKNVGFKYKMQIVRLRTTDGGKLVGLLIPSTTVLELTDALCQSVTTQSAEASPGNYDVIDDAMASSDDDIDEYDDVDEYDPDDVLSSVLFSRKEWS